MATEVASLFARIWAKDELTAGLKKADGSLSSFSNKLKNLGGGLQSAGAQLTKFTLPLAAGLGASIKLATDFEEAMANAGAILGKNADEMEDLNDEILDMGRKSVAGPQKVAESYFDIVSGVADASTHMDILSAAIATSEAGAADLQATTGALIGVMNAYSFSADQAGTVSDIMTSTVANGVLTMDELAAALPNVSTLAATLGIDFAEVSGSLALITKGGTSATTASTNLRAAMISLINPNQTMIDALEELGYESGEAALAELGLQGALDAVSGTTTAAESGMAKLFGSTEALGAALALTTDEAEKFLLNFQGIPTAFQEAGASMLVRMGDAENIAEALDMMGIGFDGATEKAQAIQNASPAAQFALLQSNVEGAAIAIGGELLPALTELSQELMPIVDDIIEWMDANPELTKQILGVGVALVVAGPALALAGTLITAIGTAVLIATSPLTLFLLALGAILFIANELAKALGFAGIAEAVQVAMDSWKGNIENVITIVQLVWDAFWDKINDAMTAFKRAIQNALNALIDAINPILEALGIGKINRIEWIIDVDANISPAAQRLMDFGVLPSTIYEEAERTWSGGAESSTAAPSGGRQRGRADGGPVERGLSYLVGEEGPELFVPGRSGMIIPNNALGNELATTPAAASGRGGGLVITGDVHVSGVQTTSELYDALIREGSMRGAVA